MSRKGIFTGIYLKQFSVCLGLGGAMAANRLQGNFWSDENVLKLDFNDGYTDLDVY